MKANRSRPPLGQLLGWRFFPRIIAATTEAGCSGCKATRVGLDARGGRGEAPPRSIHKVPAQPRP